MTGTPVQKLSTVRFLSQPRGLPDAGLATARGKLDMCTPSTQLDSIIEERVPPEGYTVLLKNA
jgi:hypothetical protein